MDIKPTEETISHLLGSRRQFEIPRFQREYSWDRKNYEEFFKDMMDNLTIKDGKISINQYFLGTMLFIGDITERTDQGIQVVDGQQRLTTITILFSALSDKFRLIKQNTLSQQIFNYIMTKDDDGNNIRIIKSKTSYPYFAYFIQDRLKEVSQEPTNDEESNIKSTYDYFIQKLDETTLKTMLKYKNGSEGVEALSYVDILKALRDQVLNSTFILISTKDRKQANKIFEILNAKGKRLAHIDLIKNKIFEILKEQEPADFAEDRWNKIKDILNSGNETVGLATFYRHFWISKYKKSYSNRLYEDFNSTIVPKTEEKYKQFLEDMLTNAKCYVQIVNPSREDYSNRKEYFWLVQSLNAINNYFNVVQARIALLALYDIKKRNIIDLKTFKNAILFIENFHFAYNAVFTGRANRLEKIYSTFSIGLRKCTTKLDAQALIYDKLYTPLNGLFPSFDEFSIRFVKLTYSKKDNPSNMKTKYAINKLNNYFSQKEIFEDDGSIEHLVPETEGDYAFNIGNLILLEQPINNDAGQKKYSEKISYYKRSNYAWINRFIEKHHEWDNSFINMRAIEMSKIYYNKILGRDLSTH